MHVFCVFSSVSVRSLVRSLVVSVYRGVCQFVSIWSWPDSDCQSGLGFTCGKEDSHTGVFKFSLGRLQQHKRKKWLFCRLKEKAYMDESNRKVMYSWKAGTWKEKVGSLAGWEFVVFSQKKKGSVEFTKLEISWETLP